MADRGSGRAGEEYARDMLLRRGFEILEMNYHTRYGEIDIIARDGDYIVFVEVKTRAQGGLYPPSMAVTPAKRKKIIASAYIYMQENETPLQPRFDVIGVLTAGKSGFTVTGFEHYENAFDAG